MLPTGAVSPRSNKPARLASRPGVVVCPQAGRRGRALMGVWWGCLHSVSRSSTASDTSPPGAAGSASRAVSPVPKINVDAHAIASAPQMSNSKCWGRKAGCTSLQTPVLKTAMAASEAGARTRRRKPAARSRGAGWRGRHKHAPCVWKAVPSARRAVRAERQTDEPSPPRVR